MSLALAVPFNESFSAGLTACPFGMDGSSGDAISGTVVEDPFEAIFILVVVAFAGRDRLEARAFLVN